MMGHFRSAAPDSVASVEDALPGDYKRVAFWRRDSKEVDNVELDKVKGSNKRASVEERWDQRITRPRGSQINA